VQHTQAATTTVQVDFSLLLVLFFSRLNKQVADLQKKLSNFGVW